MKPTLMYTCVHGLVFIVLGEIAAYFVLLPKKNPSLGLSIVALFLVLEFGFVGTAFVFAKPVFHELAWPMVLLGNFLAAAGMASYLWLRHPRFVLSSVVNLESALKSNWCNSKSSSVFRGAYGNAKNDLRIVTREVGE